jgi:hypothetical protein
MTWSSDKPPGIPSSNPYGLDWNIPQYGEQSTYYASQTMPNAMLLQDHMPAHMAAVSTPKVKLKSGGFPEPIPSAPGYGFQPAPTKTYGSSDVTPATLQHSSHSQSWQPTSTPYTVDEGTWQDGPGGWNNQPNWPEKGISDWAAQNAAENSLDSNPPQQETKGNGSW